MEVFVVVAVTVAVVAVVVGVQFFVNLQEALIPSLIEQLSSILVLVPVNKS